MIGAFSNWVSLKSSQSEKYELNIESTSILHLSNSASLFPWTNDATVG